MYEQTSIAYTIHYSSMAMGCGGCDHEGLQRIISKCYLPLNSQVNYSNYLFVAVIVDWSERVSEIESMSSLIEWSEWHHRHWGLAKGILCKTGRLMVLCIGCMSKAWVLYLLLFQSKRRWPMTGVTLGPVLILEYLILDWVKCNSTHSMRVNHGPCRVLGKLLLELLAMNELNVT